MKGGARNWWGRPLAKEAEKITSAKLISFIDRVTRIPQHLIPYILKIYLIESTEEKFWTYLITNGITPNDARAAHRVLYSETPGKAKKYTITDPETILK